MQITRSIGGGPSETIYLGSFDGLASRDSFSNAIGSVWRSRNEGDLIGSDAREAIYTVSLSLPASVTEGASSQAGVSLVFEARNATE